MDDSIWIAAGYASIAVIGLRAAVLWARSRRRRNPTSAARGGGPTGAASTPPKSAVAPGQLDLSSATNRPPTPINPTSPAAPNLGAAPQRPTVKHVTLDLDPGQFAPITDAEAKREAQAAGNLFRNVWFGRRDRIPPTSDPRTLLIDRAMVGHGLLSPEDLTEIHKVGDEMAQARPDMSDAHAAANRAVTDDLEDRKRRKEQKRAEAAERKRLRAQAIAQRRQTDIIFLGRGVSTGLADRRSNLEKLAASSLPALATPLDLAEAMHLSIPRLRWLAFHSEASPVTHYVRFTIPKRSGGTRVLFAPHRSIAEAQQWILREILLRIPVHPSAHGFVADRSTVTNASAHVRRDVVLNADLTDFFPTITFPRVRGIFQQLGYSPAVATILALLCTECPRRTVQYAGKPFHVATGPRALPQGACTSPALSNLAARRLDSRLAGIAAKLGWTYTRYADDITFSASGEPASKIGYLLARLRHIAQDEGFTINEKKTRVQRPDTAQRVTGIVVNQRMGVPRKVVRRLRAILHRASREGLAAQNRENRPDFDAWVQGTIAYIHMVNPRQAEPLRKAYEAL